jgi:hypothetical protein
VKSGAANPVAKLLGVIAGMCAGADSIDDLDMLRGTGVDEAGVAPSATFAPWTWRDGSRHGEGVPALCSYSPSDHGHS